MILFSLLIFISKFNCQDRFRSERIFNPLAREGWSSRCSIWRNNRLTSQSSRGISTIPYLLTLLHLVGRKGSHNASLPGTWQISKEAKISPGTWHSHQKASSNYLGFIWFLSSLCSQLDSIFSNLLTHFIHPLIDGQFVEWLLLDAGFSKCHIPEQQRSTKEQLPDICHPVRAWNVWNELPKPCCCTKTDLTPWLFTFTFAANPKEMLSQLSAKRKVSSLAGVFQLLCMWQKMSHFLTAGQNMS